MTATLAETTSIIDGMANNDYHAHDSLSASGLKILNAQTPAHYRHHMDNPVHKGIYDLGTATHSLVLEDDHSMIEVLQFDDWRTKAVKEARDKAYAEGKVPLLAKEYEVVRAMRDSVAAHPEARMALEGGKPEQSIFWDDTSGARMRCRPDKLDFDSPVGVLISDLKTTVNADPKKFGKIAWDLGYYQQDPHYRDGVQLLTGEEPAFLFILVEKTAPYLVSVVELDTDALRLGREKNARATELYNQCKATDLWPGYPSSGPVSLPEWATKQGALAA